MSKITFDDVADVLEKNAGIWPGTFKALSSVAKKAREAAGKSNAIRGLKRIGGKAGIVAGVGAGGAIAGRVTDSVMDADDLSRSKRRMLKLFPDLAEKKHTDRAFQSIARLAPDVAKDPLAAGYFVQSVHHSAGIPTAQIESLAKTQKAISEARGGSSKELRRGLFSGLGNELARSAMKDIGGGH